MAVFVAGWGVTPNQISVASVAFAAAAAAALMIATAASASGAAVALAVAAACVQARLVCNLIDGLVAVECGKATPSGELFNDVPDRLADPIILVTCGYAVAGWIDRASTTGPEGASFFGPTSSFPFRDCDAIAMGWAAGLLAVATAYVRVLGVSLGTPADFRGPMAKPHRMAVITAACLIGVVVVLFMGFDALAAVGGVALAVIIVGCAVTIARRLRRTGNHLESRGSPDG